MSTDSPTDTQTDEPTLDQENSDTDIPHYFEDFPQALTELEYLQGKFDTAIAKLRAIHDLLETIDCDYGAATFEFDTHTLEATATTPSLEGPADDLLKNYEWDTIDIDYDADEKLYTIEMTRNFPLFARILEIDEFNV